MAMHDDLQAEQAPKRGMSSTAKVLLVLGSITGVCLLACCGVVGFFGFKLKDTIKETIKNAAEMTSSDPAVVKQRTGEVVKIDVPEEFSPVMTIGGGFGGFTMRQFIYQNKADPNSVLVIMETNQPLQPGQDAKQQREQMLEGMRQGQHMGSMDMQEESRETRNFEINGEEVPFEFIKGKAHGVPARKVVGIFPGRKGTIMFILMVAESEYDDEKIVGMIQSIRLPGDLATAVVDESEDTPEKMPANAEEPETDKADDQADSNSESASP